MIPRVQEMHTRTRYTARDITGPTTSADCNSGTIRVPVLRCGLSALRAMLLFTASRRNLWAVAS